MQVEPKENLKSSTGILAPKTPENTRAPPTMPSPGQNEGWQVVTHRVGEG